MAEILVVEDYPPMASMLSRLLRSEGHRVIRELTVAGALTHTVAFDLAVLDIDLPDGNGVDLAEELFAGRRAKRVVFFTATRERSLLERAVEYGRVVDKSLGTRGLLECLETSIAVPRREYPKDDSESCPNSGIVSCNDLLSSQRRSASQEL